MDRRLFYTTLVTDVVFVLKSSSRKGFDCSFFSPLSFSSNKLLLFTISVVVNDVHFCENKTFGPSPTSSFSTGVTFGYSSIYYNVLKGQYWTWVVTFRSIKMTYSNRKTSNGVNLILSRFIQSQRHGKMYSASKQAFCFT